MATIATHDEYLIAVGKLVQSASAADTLMFNVFYHFSGCLKDVANAIYYTIDAFPSRRNMIARVLAVTNADEDDKKLVDILADRTSTITKLRNELAHSLLLTDLANWDGPFSRHNPKHQVQPRKPVTKEYLQSLLDPSVNALKEAFDSFEKLRVKRQWPNTIYL